MPFDDLLSQALGNPALQQGVFDTLQALFETGTEQSQDYKRQQRAVQAAGAAMMGGVPGAYGAAMPAISQGLLTGHKEYGRLETQDIEVREHAIDRAIKAQMEAMQQAVALGRNAEARRHNLVMERLSGEKNNIQKLKAANARARLSEPKFAFDPLGNPFFSHGGTRTVTEATQLSPEQFEQVQERYRQQQGGMAPESMSMESRMSAPQPPPSSPLAIQEPEQAPMQMPMRAPQGMGLGPQAATPQPRPPLQAGTYRIPGGPLPQVGVDPNDAPGQDRFAGDVYGIPRSSTVNSGNRTIGGMKPHISEYTSPTGEKVQTYTSPMGEGQVAPDVVLGRDTSEKAVDEYKSAVRVRGLIKGQLYPKLEAIKNNSRLNTILNQYAYESGKIGQNLAEITGIKSDEVQSLLSTAGLIAVQMGHVYAGSRLGIQLLKWFNKHVPNNQDSPDQMRIKAKSLDEGLLETIINSAEQVKNLDPGDYLRDEHLGLMLDAEGEEVQINLALGNGKPKLMSSSELVKTYKTKMAQRYAAENGIRYTADLDAKFQAPAYDAVRALAAKYGYPNPWTPDTNPVRVVPTEGGLMGYKDVEEME